MRRLSAFTGILLAVAAACQSAGNDVARAGDRRGDAGAVSAGVPRTADRITMERGSCYRSCAQYTVTVTSTGAVTYNGIANVQQTGSAARAISEASASALMTFADSIGVLAMPDSFVLGDPACGRAIADLPRVTISFLRKGQSKTVVQDYGCSGAPRTLRQLHMRIDSVAGTATWVSNK